MVERNRAEGHAAPTIAVTGEAVLDFTAVPGQALTYRGHPGGSPLNVAVAAARQGQPTMALTQLSTDVFGEAIAAHLTDNGIDIASCPRADAPTALAFVSQDEKGNAHFQFMANGAADRLWDPRPRPVLPDSVRFLQVSSLTLFDEPARSTVLDLVRAHSDRVTIVFDPTYRPALIPSVEAFQALLDELLPELHLVKPSDQDLSFLAPGRAPSDIAGEWLARGVPAVIVTAGELGATLYRRGHDPLSVPAPKVDVVDTVGAGDTFTGTLLAALVEIGHTRPDDLLAHADTAWTTAMLRATTAAAINCTRAGCDPPTRADVVATAGP